MLLPSLHPKFTFVISHTTRSPREGEVDGREYHFLDVSGFEELLGGGGVKKNGVGGSDGIPFFIEHAKVHTNYYGTSMGSLVEGIRSGRVSILDIDVQGVLALKEIIRKLKLKKGCDMDDGSSPPLNATGGSGSKEGTVKEGEEERQINKSLVDTKFLLILPPDIDILKKRLTLRGSETPQSLNTRLETAKREIEVFRGIDFDFSIVNEDFDVAAREMRVLIDDAYCGKE